MFSSDRSPWSLPPLCCSILLSLFRAHYAGICPSSWVFFARNTRHETGLEWRQTSKCSVLTRYSCTYPVPAQLNAYSNTSAFLAPPAAATRLLSHTRAQPLQCHGSLQFVVLSGRPPSFQFCYPQALLPTLRCSFTAPSLHCPSAGASPVVGVLA